MDSSQKNIDRFFIPVFLEKRKTFPPVMGRKGSFRVTTQVAAPGDFSMLLNLPGALPGRAGSRCLKNNLRA
ncbi:hypothetical protein HM1_2678 [Heliomicrobium modesticaldum Ice1]|uniref:Uncharacterized protein n=1 Tax=Heliobacterium modesticaldum (strain ATCC 51547 / Ice1) TaxID=498761 RepID=B0TBJ4_HELMI|nr:hypothetical protein HM1_2678 [Heliomicrobium modesticaldum Ice1]